MSKNGRQWAWYIKNSPEFINKTAKRRKKNKLAKATIKKQRAK